MDGTLSIVSTGLLGRTPSVQAAGQNSLNVWITRAGTTGYMLSALSVAAGSGVEMCSGWK
jgi:hypothetical protein